MATLDKPTLHDGGATERAANYEMQLAYLNEIASLLQSERRWQLVALASLAMSAVTTLLLALEAWR